MSTHESLVWAYRVQLSLALLGIDKSADNASEARFTLCPPPDTQGYKELQIMLGRQRRIDHTQGDGNCLFRALSKEMLGHEKFHYLIRQILTQFIKENGRQFQGYVFEGTIEAHSKRMEYLGQWGTQVEIMAAATLLKAEIYVFTQESGTPVADPDILVGWCIY